jgi:Protein kinase domain/Alpha/beta hydrolase family
MSMVEEWSRARPITERVGGYALVRRIGSGGMGEVWLGQHVVSGTLGAVKRVSPLVAGPVEEFFRREGRAIARLAHPHIVPVVEVGDDFVITAFVDGQNLQRRLQTPIDPADAVRIVRQIASALAHAHDRGVVHRDVKPSNILLDHNGTAYLADFGVATFTDEDIRHRVAGTPRFMAPEQRRGDQIGPAVDQYALGRTLLEMLAGGAVPRDPVAALAELPPGLPGPLAAAVARATAPAAADRFPSIAAFGDAVGEIDLGAYEPVVRLAPEVRARSPFAWVAGALRVETIAADIARADYRLGDLARCGLLDAGEIDALLDERGLADLGFTVWASTARLGPLTDPGLLARAAEVAMLLHGWSNTREVWRLVAPAVCRDNAQAVVITPDLHGFGETPFAGVPAPDQVELGAMARTAFRLRRVLGLADVPLALVGHSMAATSLLTLADADLGAHVSRVLVNPVLVSHDPRIRRRLRGFARASRTIGRIGPVRRAIVRLAAARDPNLVPLIADAREAFVAEALRMPGGVFARVLSAFAAAPPRLGRQRRLAVFACLDDDWVDQDALDRAAADLGIEPAQIHRAATGGHNPHVELAEHPEWTARNIDQIVRLIDAMLITAREMTLTSTDPRGGDLTATAQPTTFA